MEQLVILEIKWTNMYAKFTQYLRNVDTRRLIDVQYNFVNYNNNDWKILEQVVCSIRNINLSHSITMNIIRLSVIKFSHCL